MEQVFEVGQVIAFKLGNGCDTTRVLVELWDGEWICHPYYRLEEPFVRECAQVIAPAPRPGMRWRNDDDEVIIANDFGAMRCDVHTKTGHDVKGPRTLDVVGVARWLHDNGYKPVEEKPSDKLTVGSRVRADNYRSTGRIAARVGTKLYIAWTRDGYAEEPMLHCESAEFDGCVRCGEWRVLSDGDWPTFGRHSYRMLDDAAGARTIQQFPNIAKAQPFFDLITAIYTTPSLEQTRRYVDMAVAAVKGEPFWQAIQAVLVHAAEQPMSPHVIAGLVEACRAWERRRSEVAPGLRTLRPEHFEECWSVAAGKCVLWHSAVGRVYERARAL